MTFKFKPLLHVNHKKFVNGVLFQAIFSALVFATAFLINDVLDEAIDENIHGKNQKWYKLLCHTATVFILTFIVILVLFVGFGWGKVMIES